MASILAEHGKTQARIAETEKYAHVTFFFNGGVEEPNQGEDRILVKSPKVATYDLQPEMSAPEVCDKLCAAIRSEKYDVIIINFANPDMVGHTGIMEAAIKAVETVDTCVGKAVEALKEVRRTDVHLRRPRKRRAAHRLRDRRSVYRTYDQSGSVYSDQRRSCIYVKRRRTSCGHYPDHDRYDGNGEAGRNDRRVPSDPQIAQTFRRNV